jgi:hypothetical protein
VLALVYVAIVLGHIVAFRKTYEFQYFVTDAVQYVATAQNIAGGHGYTVRGQFNSTNPPLYPAFLSATIAQSADPMWPAFVWQCIVIGLVVFPACLLAREVGLPIGVSVVLAAAAGLVPHTFFSASYMTEVLQYPLWLWACLLVHRWLRVPTLSGGVWLGIVLSLLMWNKVNSSLLVIPVVVACVVRAAGEARRGAIVRMILAVLVILCVTQGVWLLYKAAHGGNALGLYGSAARDSAHLPILLPLLLAYAFDFFLASGLLCVVPVCYFLGRRWWTDRPVVLFYGMLFALQIGWIGVYDGGWQGPCGSA